MKGIITITMGLALLFGVSYAQCPISHKVEAAVEETTPETLESIEVDNTICPVSGEEIDEETKVTYEYKGKTYNFCCEACVEEFKKDPQKYISAMGGEE